MYYSRMPDEQLTRSLVVALELDELEVRQLTGQKAGDERRMITFFEDAYNFSEHLQRRFKWWSNLSWRRSEEKAPLMRCPDCKRQATLAEIWGMLGDARHNGEDGQWWVIWSSRRRAYSCPACHRDWLEEVSLRPKLRRRQAMSVQESRTERQQREAVRSKSDEHGKWVPGYKIVRRIWDEARMKFKLLSQRADTEWVSGMNEAEPLRSVSGFSGGPLPGGQYGMHVLITKPAISGIAAIKSRDQKEVGEVLLKVYVDSDRTFIVGTDSGSAGGMIETWVTHRVRVDKADYDAAIRGDTVFGAMKKLQKKAAKSVQKAVDQAKVTAVIRRKPDLRGQRPFEAYARAQWGMNRTDARKMLAVALTTLGIDPKKKLTLAKAKSQMKATPMKQRAFEAWASREFGVSRNEARAMYAKVSK